MEDHGLDSLLSVSAAVAFVGVTRKSRVLHCDSWPGSSPPGTGSIQSGKIHQISQIYSALAWDATSSFTVRKCGLTDNQLWGIVVPLIANAQPRYEGWSQLYRHLCKMGQTRVFAASIMMFRERVRRTSSYNWRVDMGTTKEPRKESNKATLARIKKEMAQPRIAKSARKGASTRQDSQ